jgi:hypothetical protein
MRIEQQQQDEDFDEQAAEHMTEEMQLENEVTRELINVLHSLFGFGAKVLPDGGYVRYFDSISQRVINLLDPNRHYHDLQWGICVIDDLIEFTGQHSVNYAQHFAETMVTAIGSSHYEVRQAAAYGIGQMAMQVPDAYRQVCTAVCMERRGRLWEDCVEVL